MASITRLTAAAIAAGLAAICVGAASAAPVATAIAGGRLIDGTAGRWIDRQGTRATQGEP